MSTFEGPYRRLDFKERQFGSYVTVYQRPKKERQFGSYVTVYQRPKEEVRLDVVFFDGDIEIDEALLRQRLLDQAVKQAREWEDEK
jgi:hypothetical protein